MRAHCEVAGCDRPHKAKGYCDTHYALFRRNGSPQPQRRPTVEERFWSKVDRRNPDDCWTWQASFRNGYGQFGWAAGDIRPAHRVAYELLVGPIPEGLHIDHLCRQPSCVNPAHLEPVTLVENLNRGLRRNQNSGRTECQRGHPLTPENTYTHRASGKRYCQRCKRAAERARRRRVRLADGATVEEVTA